MDVLCKVCCDGVVVCMCVVTCLPPFTAETSELWFVGRVHVFVCGVCIRVCVHVRGRGYVVVCVLRAFVVQACLLGGRTLLKNTFFAVQLR